MCVCVCVCMYEVEVGTCWWACVEGLLKHACALGPPTAATPRTMHVTGHIKGRAHVHTRVTRSSFSPRLLRRAGAFHARARRTRASVIGVGGGGEGNRREDGRGGGGQKRGAGGGGVIDSCLFALWGSLFPSRRAGGGLVKIFSQRES